MAGEMCGRGCGYCGRCDAEPEHFCEQIGCEADCPERDAEMSAAFEAREHEDRSEAA